MLEKLRILFNEIDPVGLVSEENIDEYDLEIKMLLDLKLDISKMNLQDIRDVLAGIFAECFEGIEINSSYLESLARAIKENFNSIT